MISCRPNLSANSKSQYDCPHYTPSSWHKVTTTGNNRMSSDFGNNDYPFQICDSYDKKRII